MADKIEITIIGAGVIGLAIASEIGRKDKDIFIFEKNERFGEETSSRNSEVIHAGIYYPQNSLKAKTCVEGKWLLYEICEKNNIFCQMIGKLIVAKDSNEIEILENLLKNGKENGVLDLRILSQKELKAKEPEIDAKGALYSPSTGIIDSHQLMNYFLNKAKSKGVEILYKNEVINIEKIPDGYEVTILEDEREYSFHSQIVINCGGLHSDKIAQNLGIDIQKNGYELKYCKGSYFQSYKPHPLKHLIYPPPTKVSLGIHIILDKMGRLRFGPDAEYIEKKIDYQVDISKRKLFYNSVKKFLPFIKEKDLFPDTAGIRPKLQGPDEDFKDFIIKEEKDKGFPNFINLIGIDSPGLTSAPAIARYVKKILER